MSMDVSFLIPAYNEQHHLQSCVTSISQFAPAGLSWEIIIADNYSLDDTFQIAKSFDDEHEDIRAYKCEGPIGRVRNFLADAARGNVLVFLDADTVLTKAWGDRYRQVHEAMAARPRIITGSRLCGIPDNSMVYRGWFAHIGQRLVEYINSGHMIINREEFRQLRGFDEEMMTGEDVEFCQRARLAGMKILPNAHLQVIHQRYPDKVWSFFQRERWHAVGDYQGVSRYIHSKAAIAGTIYVVAIILTVLGSARLALAGLGILMLLPVAASWYKFPRLLWKERIANIGLSAVYLTARGLPKWGVPR